MIGLPRCDPEESEGRRGSRHPADFKSKWWPTSNRNPRPDSSESAETVFEGGKSGGGHPSWTKPVATKPPNTTTERSRIRTRVATVALATNATSLVRIVSTSVTPFEESTIEIGSIRVIA